MKRISILGLGWLGYPLAKKLIEKGYSVCGTSTTQKKVIDMCEASNINVFEYALSENVPTILLDELSKSELIIIAIPASKTFLNLSNLVALFDRLNPDKEIILISSTGVYPDSIENAEENYEFQDEDKSNTNVQIEITLKEQIKQRLTILRLAGLIGPNRHPITILSQKTNIPDGLAPVNLIHLNDVIALIEKVIEKGYFGEIINGCYPEHPTREDYYSKAALKFKLPIPSFQKNTLKRKIVSSNKSQIDLGFTYNQRI